jgi:flavin reductase (DIM6/NTAB) family NADH-FMN oxidoreductase RutF
MKDEKFNSLFNTINPNLNNINQTKKKNNNNSNINNNIIIYNKMYLSNPVVTKVPCSINVLSSVTQSLSKCNFSTNQPNHFLFSKKMPSKVSNSNGQSFQKVPTSNSNWKMGETQKILSGKTLTFEPSVFSSSQLHQFLLGSFPRPACIISTISPEGISNAAPYSFTNLVCSDPPTFSLTVFKNPDGSLKDTQVNIDASNEFAVNLISDWFIESAHASGMQCSPDVSEFEKIGFTPKPSTIIKSPLVAQSPVNYECKVSTRIPFINREGKETAICYMGEIVKIHVNEQVYDADKATFKYENLKALVKLGGPLYAKINTVVDPTQPTSSSQ